MKIPFQDRRKHVRVYRNFILSCRLKADTKTVFEMCQVHNISKGGVSFSSTVPFHKDSELNIEIKTHFINDKVELEGKVIESKEKIRNLIYTIHVQFFNVSDQAMNALGKIEQYSSQQG